jgi:hypothetical protein
MNMSEKSLQVLKNAGWKTGRKIDIRKTISFLESKQFEVFPIAKAILEEYGGLTTYYKTSVIDSQF